MFSSQHLLTNYQKKMFNIDHDNHVKRMENIDKSRKKLTEDKNQTMRSTFFDLHSKHIQFQTTEKIGSLDKTNKVLLDKLVKISKNQKPALYKSTKWSGHPGTLNTTYRKKELERIAHENEAMAKRLISQQSSVDHKKFKLDFLKQRELMKISQKSPFVSPKSSAKLPPLQSPKLEESPKDMRAKNKKKERKSEGAVESKDNTANKTIEKTQEESQPAIHVVDPVQHSKSTKEISNKSQSQLQEGQAEETNQSKSTQKEIETNTNPSQLNASQTLENKTQEIEESMEKSTKKPEVKGRSRNISNASNASRKGSKKLSAEPTVGEQLNKSIEIKSPSKEIKEVEKTEEKEETPVAEENETKKSVENVEASVEKEEAIEPQKE